MKYSEAILRGFSRVHGRQNAATYYEGHYPRAPKSVCVLGAANLAITGNANRPNYKRKEIFRSAFLDTWGFLPDDLNDKGMPWEHIYGMARAAGL